MRLATGMLLVSGDENPISVEEADQLNIIARIQKAIQLPLSSLLPELFENFREITK